MTCTDVDGKFPNARWWQFFNPIRLCMIDNSLFLGLKGLCQLINCNFYFQSVLDEPFLFVRITLIKNLLEFFYQTVSISEYSVDILWLQSTSEPCCKTFEICHTFLIFSCAQRAFRKLASVVDLRLRVLTILNYRKYWLCLTNLVRQLHLHYSEKATATFLPYQTSDGWVGKVTSKTHLVGLCIFLLRAWARIQLLYLFSTSPARKENCTQLSKFRWGIVRSGEMS